MCFIALSVGLLLNGQESILHDDAQAFHCPISGPIAEPYHVSQRSLELKTSFIALSVGLLLNPTCVWSVALERIIVSLPYQWAYC